MRVVGLAPSAFIGFYAARLRQHPLQELLAGAGIAVGVALVFAVQVANGSITGSAEQIVEGIAGSATLQMAARSEEGFDEHLATRVQRLAGVRRAAPILRTRAAIVGPDGRESIEFLGATPALGDLGGQLTRNFGRSGLQLTLGIALPAEVARSLDVESGDNVRLLVDGREQLVAVGAVLDDAMLGPLAGSRAALAPLPLVQAASGHPGQLSQILVEPVPGRTDEVRRELERLASGRVGVAPADAELAVLRKASKPNDQSTQLFAGISAMVGFLFSLNAMLFTMAERRRFIADLRLEGARPRQILAILGFEALVLGIVASVAGLLLGGVLSRLLFGDVPDYLTFAFPVGTQRVVDAWTVVPAFATGILAALVASIRPALDLRPSQPVDAVDRQDTEPGEAIGRRATARLFVAGSVLAVATTLVALAVPAATILGAATLAVAALLVMPATFAFVASRLDRLTRRVAGLNVVALALMELRGTTTRSMALAAVAALAVYGSVSIGGARADLVDGLDSHTREWLSNADLWVTTGGQDLMTNSFPLPPGVAALRTTPGIADVRIQRGGFLDVGDRRMWLLGRPVDDRIMIPPSQLRDGDLGQATRRLRAAGWATISDELADARDLAVGDSFVLPTPTGDKRFRVAAVTMNMGWIPGAVVINARDYARVIGTARPSALEVDLAADTTPAEGLRLVEAALGPRSGLTVQTRREREVQYFEFGRQGVARLNQIALLLLIAAALAVACALIAMVMQRRPRLAAMKIQGARRGQLWGALLVEAAILVAVGCGVGCVLGVLGHLLAGRYLRLATGFASDFALGLDQLVVATGVVAGIALIVSALPGFLAANTPIRGTYQE